jgi:hypothetical protein
VNVIEVVLAPTAHELSEVRCDGAAIKWFSEHAAALAFAARYASAMKGDDGATPFVSVCRTDGKWVALSELAPVGGGG